MRFHLFEARDLSPPLRNLFGRGFVFLQNDDSLLESGRRHERVVDGAVLEFIEKLRLLLFGYVAVNVIIRADDADGEFSSLRVRMIIRVKFRRYVPLELRVYFHVVYLDALGLRRSQQRIKPSARVPCDEELEWRGGQVRAAPGFGFIEHVGVLARGGEHLKLRALDVAEDDLRRVRSFRHEDDSSIALWFIYRCD